MNLVGLDDAIDDAVSLEKMNLEGWCSVESPENKQRERVKVAREG